MISLGQIKVGTKIIFKDSPYEVIIAEHLKMGRGGAKLVTKLRNLLNQSVIDYTFAGEEKLEEADISYSQAQFLYQENDQAFFMATDDFATVQLKLPESRLRYLKEGQTTDLLMWQGQAIDANIPKKVELTISYTEPGFKGNTASAALKPATLETGAQVNVPLFLDVGDKILINTDTGAYDSRVGR